MKKKIVSVVICSAMAAAMLAGCGSSSSSSDTAASTADTTAATEATTTADTTAAEETTTADTTAATESTDAAAEDLSYDGEIKIWVADAVVDFTKEQVANFQAQYPGLADATFTVEAVGEGDAASNMITDVEAGADIYGFAQDQLARLAAAGALEPLADNYAEEVTANNDEGSVAAATVGDSIYAYPMTSDNGYFLYYDSSVIPEEDAGSLEQILADCEAAGKYFYMDIANGWYIPSFFFGTGCDISYETDADGNFTAANVSVNGSEGMVALKEIIEMASSSAFQNGSSAGDANSEKIAAIVDGTWDSATVKELFGDNYACAKLPEFTGSDGATYQMSGFSGYKLLGEKPQTDENKLAVCDALAAYLTSEDVQLARYEAVGWGPSNVNAQASDEVQADEALSALNDQMQYDIPQGQYPNSYWDLAGAVGSDVNSGTLTADTSDDDLQAALDTFQTNLENAINE